MQDPQDLIVYQRALAYAVECARLARKIDERQAPGLSGQLARAAFSVPSNISEGVGQPSDRACAQFLGVAMGSLNESETQVRLAHQLCPQIGGVSAVIAESGHLRRMLFALRAHFVRKASQTKKPRK